MPAQRITVANVTQAISYTTFLLIVLASYVGLCLLDIYLESGGIQLAFPSMKWPREVAAVLSLMGIPAEYIKPYVAIAAAITGVSIAGSYLIIHYGLYVLGSGQNILKRAYAWRNGQNPDANVLIDEGYPVFKLLFLAVVVLVLYTIIFAKWTQPFAQLQLASKFWETDFGDGLGVNAIPDIHALMEKHRGEFSWLIVNGFPKALFVLHFLTGLLAEIFLLHVATSLGSFTDHSDEIARTMRTRVTNAFRGSSSRSNRNETADAGATHEDPHRQATDSRPSTTENALHVEESARSDTNGHGDDAADQELAPEDQPVRVVGGSETITPREAMQRPELYEVLRNEDGQNGHSYVIYTREFYENMQGGRV